jgi:alkaline phosphatase
LLGLFAGDDLPYENERPASIPDLGRMTARAVEILSGDPDGFVLVVEGGRIDHAEHGNRIADAIADLLAFDAAVGYALDYRETSPGLTIVVTADHDCGAPSITGTGYGYPTYDDLESMVEDDSPYVRWVSDTHTATMVPVFARGPGSSLFSGIQHNSELHHDLREVLGL